MQTILLIEDESAIQHALTDKLKEEGFDVLEAKNGEDGLKMAKEKHPDLILLDIIMPIMDGITMFKELRKDEWGKDAKIIFLTNLSEEERISEVLNLGTAEYLIKTDWSLADVVKKIREKLK